MKVRDIPFSPPDITEKRKSTMLELEVLQSVELQQDQKQRNLNAN